MIELRDVRLPHGIADRISFSVDRGGFVGLIGANGAGKTTLLRVIARLARPRSGLVRIDGRELSAYARAELARTVAGVWQRQAPAFGFTARQIVLLGRTPHLRPLRWETRHDEEVVDAALAETRIAHLASRVASTLSAGELQRVFIAAALAQQSRILLLDEPTSFLDLRQAAHLSALFRRLTGAGTTIVCATHDLELLRRHATSIVALHDRGAEQLAPEAALSPAALGRFFGVEEEAMC